MKNKNRWFASKFIYKKGKLTASRDPKEVYVGSRLTANLCAELFEKYIPQYARGKLIDLGCGKVPLYGVYKNYVKEILCVDWGNTYHKSEHLDFECDINQTLPFKDGEFDTIILSDVLEHIYEPHKLWLEMSRILSVDGIVILNVPFYFWLHEGPHDYYRYTRFVLKRFAETTGFQVILLKAIGGSPEVMTDLFAKHFSFIPFVGDMLADTLQFFTRIFIKTSFGRRISEKSSIVFPLGYFMIAQKAKESL